MKLHIHQKMIKILFRCISIILVAFVVLNSVVSHAASGTPINITTLTSDPIIIGVEGEYITDTAQNILEVINGYRYEACEEGVINPSTGKPLTLDDYVPIKWSRDLETIARLRSVEASLNIDHQRCNGYDCFSVSSNGVSGSGESLAWNSAYSDQLYYGIRQWYDEKDDYVNKMPGATTGHYTALIDPGNKYIGLGCFKNPKGSYNYCVAAQFSGRNGLSETKSSDAGTVTQPVEVNKSYFKSINADDVIIEPTGKTPIDVTVTMDILDGDGVSFTNTYKPLNATYTSSDTSVLTIDSNGNMVPHKIGNAVVTVNLAGNTETFNVTVGIRVDSITFDVSEKSIDKGESFTIAPTILPENAHLKTLEWKSSNTVVATVDENGKVTGIGPGKADITATSKDGGNVSASTEVKVYDYYPKADTPYLRDNKFCYLLVGGEFSYEYSIDGGKNWQNSGYFPDLNSNTEYSIISRKPGSGYYKTSPVSDPLVVTTMSFPRSIALNKNELKLKIGDEFKLTTSVTPANGEIDGYEWVSQDDSVISVDTEATSENTVTALSNGKTTVTVYADFANITRYLKDVCTIYVYADQPGIGKPVLLEKSTTSITLKKIDGAEYSMDNGDTWQKSNIFNNLDPDKTYVFTQRLAQDDEKYLYAGPVEGSAQISTDPIYISEFELSVDSIKMHSGYSLVLPMTLTPDDATRLEFSIESDNENVAEAVGPSVFSHNTGITINGIGEGEAKITIKAKEGPGEDTDFAAKVINVKVYGQEHIYDETILTEPTCTEKGRSKFVCSVCGNTFYKDTDALGHIKVTDNRVEPGCETTGLTEGSHCDRCKKVFVEQKTIDALGHIWDEGTVISEPNCHDFGTEKFVCERCKKERYEDIAKLPHVIVKDKRVEPTCEASGLTEGKHCSVCKEVLVPQKVISPQGHKWDSGVVVKEATETAEGIMLYTCTVCGKEKQVTIPKKEKNPSEDTVTMFRLYNKNSGEHFYTASESERDTLVEVGWNYEGVAWNAPKTSGVPVYRLYNPNAGDHHYTRSKDEADNLVKAGWSYEGIGWYSDEAERVPLYRLYNPNAVAGSHHYTISSNEKDELVKAGWKYEGIAWYGSK